MLYGFSIPHLLFVQTLSYYIDYNYKENLLATATEKRNVRRLAEFLGYKTANKTPSVVKLKVEDATSFEGINFSTGNKEDLKSSGILDPAKVTRCALKNAVSVAGTLLLTNHSIVHQ